MGAFWVPLVSFVGFYLLVSRIGESCLYAMFALIALLSMSLGRVVSSRGEDELLFFVFTFVFFCPILLA